MLFCNLKIETQKYKLALSYHTYFNRLQNIDINLFIAQR